MKITDRQETLIIFLIFAMLISSIFYVLVQTEKMKRDNTVCQFLFDEHEFVVELSQVYINYGLNATEFWCNHYCPKSVKDAIEHAKHNILNNMKE